MTEPQLSLRDADPHDRVASMALLRASLLPEDTSDETGLERLVWGSKHGAAPLVAATQGEELIGLIGGVVAVPSATIQEEPTGYVTVLAVRPDRRRRGVGRALVSALESRLSACGAVQVWTGGSQPNYWWPGIDRQYGAARGLFLSAGYVNEDGADNLIVELSRSVAHVVPVTGVRMRRLSPDEFPRFQSWVRSTFDEVWDRELEMTLAREPISCFVAEENGDYVGFAAYDTNRVGWFGPMGSATAVRGRGIGAALLRLCLRDYALRGDRDCQIAWAGPQKFYRDAVAARPGRAFDRLRKALPS
jgi:ribosomal protein S18 acetylase RimI-like enzyme